MQIKMESKTCFSADCLRNKLYRNEEILLLDCRSNEEYRHGHIIDSHNIVLPQLMMRRLKANKLSLKSLVPPNFRQEKEAFLKKCMTHEVVLYDQHTFELTDNDTTMLCLLYNRLKAEGCNVFVLKNGYTKFESDHPEFCFKADNSSDADDEDFGSDESTSTSPRGGRCSPVSPLNLAPSILGLGSLRISCEPIERDETNDLSFRLPVNNRPNRCMNHCDRFNSEGESDDPNSANSLSSSESGNAIKPSPLTIQHNCTCHSNKNSACPSPAVHSHPSYGNASLPAEILPGLFLGCAKDASSADTLAQCNITYVLNVTPNLPNVFEKDPKYCYKQIPITDHWSQNLSQFFPEAIAFIDEARSKNCGVLVHCLAGISRSVTVTVAYLMQKLRWSLNDAYDFVKQRKSNVSPNFNFMGQLLDFEKTLGLGEYSSPEDDSSNPNAPSTPPTLFFTTTPPPTPTLTLPVMAQPVSALEVRTAFVLPTPRA